jgi:hypothetical protein
MTVQYVAPLYTWLSLNRFARIMGVDPVHFWGCNQINTPTGRVLHPLDNAQNNIWPNFDYDNSDQVSRNQLARTIWSCEQEISDYLAMNLTPDWDVDDTYSPESTWDGQYSNGVVLRKKNFIRAGVRSTSFIGNIAINFTDDDGDGFKEVGSIIVSMPVNAKANEIKIYYPGYSGEREFEIRDPFYAIVSNGNLIIKFNSWQLVDPELYSDQANNDNVGNVVDVSDPTSLLSFVDVYWEYNDFTKTSVTFVDVEDDGSETYPTGYFIVKDRKSRIAIPYEATYDISSSRWNGSPCSQDYSYLKLSYYSGYEDPRTNGSIRSDKLSDQFAKAIAYMATSRLDRVYLTNTNATEFANTLRDDVRVLRKGEGFTRVTSYEMNNPFGTHKGEIYAWKAIASKSVSLGGGLV